jgi:hypothetical protein
MSVQQVILEDSLPAIDGDGEVQRGSNEDTGTHIDVAVDVSGDAGALHAPVSDE